ncbi:hypothetical protein B0T10DRAFT_594984 [Thelonectria olida]|uniref:Uncharacterized protein n=1 Tax=Thelonectria olida TaxID=1576542 RepID=A0A9P8VPM2_9HYPO|nr:hypothetical protein B0T10DRAFT_594984 [Thelonectria olida]
MANSTLFLKEAIAYAHISSLHQHSFSFDLTSDTAQYYLRIAWILVIDDSSFTSASSTSHLQTSSNASQATTTFGWRTRPGFCNSCKLFQSFDDAWPPDVRFNQYDLPRSMSGQLCRKRSFLACDNQIQHEDIVITGSWLRAVLWKTAIPYVDATTGPNDRGQSVSLPMSVARDLLPSQALESQGPGMVDHARFINFRVGVDLFIRYLNYLRSRAPLPTASYHHMCPGFWQMSAKLMLGRMKVSVRWAA